jgi:hypothetical protein
MSLFTLPSTQPQPFSRRSGLPGTPHWGVPWKNAVITLKAATRTAMCHARLRSRFTPDSVGGEVIDLVGQLDGFALAVLHVVIGELARQSKKGDHRSW